ncbi:PEP-CTERM sorting domain-containing protein [Zooshikella marina]|uniref:PEP-CTERM sorting domain-containing protein n=1 Tax=Zooshikella ganghwensis TaxID=202772 RepID=UPI001BAE60CF|nr:PEP-CTERM sorting domain-containing protein [Zooshikella ganghwensis]MBU2706101.1 PEP-CTERM sorting domain-containing protein [Zooshikella ganghwensis]
MLGNFFKRGALLTSLIVLPWVNASATTVIDVNVHNWEWTMDIQSITGERDTAIATGNATIRFDSNGLFDFGTVEAPTTVPPGPPLTIDTEIISMDLRGSSPILGGEFSVRTNNLFNSVGQITDLQNVGGTLIGNSFFDVFVEIELFDENMSIFSPESDPIPLSMLLTPENGPPANDVLWIPFFMWQTVTVNTPELVDMFNVPWDTVLDVHTTIPGMAWDIPEPSAFMLFAIGVLASLRSRKRLNRA